MSRFDATHTVLIRLDGVDRRSRSWIRTGRKHALAMIVASMLPLLLSGSDALADDTLQSGPAKKAGDTFVGANKAPSAGTNADPALPDFYGPGGLIRPDPNYRIVDYKGMGVPKNVVDELVGMVKAKILADPKYVGGPDLPDWHYNKGVPPSGDQLTADANYLVERAIGREKQVDGSVNIDKVREHLIDSQDPPGYQVTQKEGASKDEPWGDEPWEEKGSQPDPKRVGKRQGDPAKGGPPADTEDLSVGDDPSVVPKGWKQPDTLKEAQAGQTPAGPETLKEGQDGPRPGGPDTLKEGQGGQTPAGTQTLKEGGQPASGTPPEAPPSSGLRQGARNIADSSIINAFTSYWTCIQANPDQQAQCAKASGISTAIGASCSTVQELSRSATVGFACNSLLGYKACIMSGRDPNQCLSDWQSGIPPAAFCAGVALLNPAAGAICGAVVPSAYEALVATAEAGDAERQNRVLGPIVNRA